MKQPGITALAHPLDTKVATRHGVFVFEDIEEIRKRYREGNEGYCSVILNSFTQSNHRPLSSFLHE